uniref:Uncharacterized protein n=1 Tax=Palpitomonas bilix TaxID=652834 RepID=A0A7S3G581_9EUKA|mmetsp:Transcript_19945/g.50945  ORF Transcript_19945/g.50945 Transcript_19945/m.50945 type:complete len:249 (+) Transcript_19945:73-819(+)
MATTRATYRVLSSRFSPLLSSSLTSSAVTTSISPAISASSVRGMFKYFKKEERERMGKEARDEMKKSYFQDYADLQKNKGKYFLAESKLEELSKSSFIPDMEGANLKGESAELKKRCKGKTSVLFLSFRDSATPMIEEWRKVVDNYKGIKNFQVFEVTFLDGPLLGLMSGLLRATIAKNTPPELHASTFVVKGNSGAARRELQMENRLTAYVWLVDKNGRIRWRAVGAPAEQELEGLHKLAKQLSEGR